MPALGLHRCGVEMEPPILATELLEASPPRVEVAPHSRLPLSAVVVYGLPVLGVGYMWNMIGFFYMKYATDVLLIAPATMGLIFGLSRLWDAVDDPLAGYWSDRTRTRLGRRRPWLLAAALPLGMLFVALWAPPRTLGTRALVAWEATAIFLFSAALTAFRVPHLSLGAELSDDHHERTRIFTWVQAFEVIGGLLGLAVLAWLIAARVDLRDGAFWMASGAAVLGSGLTLLAASKLRERPEYLDRGARRPWAATRDVGSNPHARRLLAVALLQSTGLSCVGATVPYASEYLLGGLDFMPKLLLAYAGAVALAMPLWAPLSRRFGKRETWIASMAVQASAFLGIFLLPEPEPLPILVLTALVGAMDGAGGVLGRSIKADVIDWDELRTGERKEGTYFAGWSLASKIGVALSAAIVGGVLELSGFEPNVAQGATSRIAIQSLLGLAPAVAVLLGLGLLLGFRFDEAQHASVRARLSLRSSGQSNRESTARSTNAPPAHDPSGISR